MHKAQEPCIKIAQAPLILTFPNFGVLDITTLMEFF